jgi:hypothetical protein
VFEFTKKDSRCHFFQQTLKFVKKEELCFRQALLFKKKKAKASNAGRGCCSKEL